VGLPGDARDTLERLLPFVEARNHTEWLGEFTKCAVQEEEQVIVKATKPKQGPLKMSEVVYELSVITRGQAVVVADVGQHQMMAARYYSFAHHDSWVTSGGLGTMGFALPAAMGVQVGLSKKGIKDISSRPVVIIAGDGGFQMNSQELMTIAQERLPVKMIILNNNFLGMVRQWQELFFDNRYSSVDMQNPDFVKLGEAYGITSSRVSERADLGIQIQRMLDHKGPFLLEVCVETEQNVFPMVPAGASVSDIRLE
jgi:acetolactate synthase-1/2/3 large subunit